MEFRLLGPLEVRADARPVPLGRPKERALLALLLLRANRVVARERLIDELWPEEPPETAVKAVQVYVSHLRKVLPADMLVTRSPGYLLVVDPENVDVLRFERLVGDARRADAAVAASLLREALGLWRGSPLAEFEEPFARVEAGRLQDLRLAALEERIEADLAVGRHGELTGELETLIAEEPHRERLRSQLMLALYRSGRQAEALAAYRDAQAALAELGLEPSMALRQLERQVLSQDVRLDLPEPEPSTRASALPGPLVPDSPFPFVGRAAELVVLESLLGRAMSGEGALALVAGEAGAGKTRLIREFAREAAARGAVVLYGSSDAAVSTPYQPLREWIEFLLHVCPPETLRACLPSRNEGLTRLVPELARLVGPPQPFEAETGADRFVLQSAACELLRRLSVQQPLLLIADDLHWADDETLSLLQRLARAAPEAPMLVLAAFRDRGEELRPAFHDTLADLSRLDGVIRLGLGNLTVEDVGAFVAHSTGAEASPGLAAAIGELSDGTPLLLCELWRELQESGAVELSDTGVRVSRPLTELRGADRLRDVVQQRVARLAPETSAVLDLAAVAGPRFELRVLASAAALDSDALLAAVDEAVTAGLIEELPERVPAGRFSHELVRRAIYDRIRPIRRAELHLRIGEALERTNQSDVSRVLPDLAHHFTLAVPVAGVERAVDYNLRAGDAAIATAAFDEAATRLSSALELGIDDPRERARVQIELSHVFNEVGRYIESYAIMAESLDAATGLGERGLAAQALVQRTSQLMFSNPDSDPEEIFRVADAAIATFTELGDTLGLAVATRLRSLAFKRVGREGDAYVEAERALVHAEASGHHAARRRVVATLVYALTEGSTPVPEGIARCEQLLRTYPDDPVLRALIGRALAALLAMAGRFDEARQQASESTPLLDELKQLTTSGVYRVIAADARELIGDVAGAKEELTAMWRDLRNARGGAPDGRAMAAAYRLALMCCDEERWNEAAEWLAYGQDVPDATRFTHGLVLRLAASARLAAHERRFPEAVALAERAVKLEDQSQRLNLRARMWLALAEVERAAGSTAAAGAAVAEAIRLYEAKGNVTGARRAERGAATATDVTAANRVRSSS